MVLLNLPDFHRARFLGSPNPGPLPDAKDDAPSRRCGPRYLIDMFDINMYVYVHIYVYIYIYTLRFVCTFPHEK